MAALKYWLWLTGRRGLGAASALTVLEHFLTPERAYWADPEEYRYLPLDQRAKESLLDKSLDDAYRILGDCERLGIHLLTIQDADYPERLRQIADPPTLLYGKGKLFHFDEEAALGVVGTRTPTEYGKITAEKLSMELTRSGMLVVSGMAEGIDTCAVRGALSGGGPVVSVLGGGIDMPFPPQNRGLYADVAAAGALISEYPPGTPNRGGHFPRRNRIISGLCLGVLAVECGVSSGTMITVNHALEQDRDVFAVPGAINAPMSEGPNRMIQQGAKLVIAAQDILEEYRDRFPAKLLATEPLPPEAAQARLKGIREGERTESKSPRSARQEDPPAPPEEVAPEPQTAPKREFISREAQKARFTDDQVKILLAMEGDGCSVDELVERTQLPTRRLLSALTMLQLLDTVEELTGQRFAPLVELEK